MDPTVAAAGSALVAAMATDAWEHARDGAVALWRRFRPEETDDIGSGLEMLRSRALAAHRSGDEETQEALVGVWRLALQDLIGMNPQAAEGLEELLHRRLMPALTLPQQEGIRSIVQRAKADGGSSITQAGGNVSIRYGSADDRQDR